MSECLYRVTTNGRTFRVEMLDPDNKYNEWTPLSAEFPTLDQAQRARDEYANAKPGEWMPVGPVEA